MLRTKAARADLAEHPDPDGSWGNRSAPLRLRLASRRRGIGAATAGFGEKREGGRAPPDERELRNVPWERDCCFAWRAAAAMCGALPLRPPYAVGARHAACAACAH